jgi:hypothetical protein
MCDLIGKTLALIPTEYDKERLSACAFVLDDQVRHQSDMECTLRVPAQLVRFTGCRLTSPINLSGDHKSIDGDGQKHSHLLAGRRIVVPRSLGLSQGCSVGFEDVSCDVAPLETHRNHKYVERDPP